MLLLPSRTILLLSLILSLSTAQADDKKYALIIGNSNYQHTSTLPNPMNDAIDISEVLRELDFDVDIHINVMFEDMQKAATTFISNLNQSKGVGLFFYAGHGAQLEGDNYLLPVDANIAEQAEIARKGFNVAKLLDSMRAANNKTNIIILDACRDNPFAGSSQAGQRSLNDAEYSAPQTSAKSRTLKRTEHVSPGLSKLDAPKNTLIAFATAPGKTADDGTGRNSPYTNELLTTLQQEGLTVEQVFKAVRNNVIMKSKGKQIPWESSSLVNEFYFKPRKTIPLGW